jgi:phytoene/squalene synthetase
MPLERLQQHWLSHKDLTNMIKSTEPTLGWGAFMHEQIQLTKKLYKEANTWIRYLQRDGRKAVYLASQLYEAILDKIAKNNNNVFGADCHTTKREKFFVLCRWLVRYAFSS